MSGGRTCYQPSFKPRIGHLRLTALLPALTVYGWRNAEIENLEKMLKGEASPIDRRVRKLTRTLRADFKPIRQVFLEQNYRSTGAILGAALAVVRQGEWPGGPRRRSEPLTATRNRRHEADQQVAHDFAPVRLVRRPAPGPERAGRSDLYRLDDPSLDGSPRWLGQLQRLCDPPPVRRAESQHRSGVAEEWRAVPDGRRAQIL